MVDYYGRWKYEPNTHETRKCDCDRIADWIIGTDYEVKTTIENLVLNILAHFDCCDNYGGEYGDEFTVEGCKKYVENSGGLKEFDYEV